MSQRRGLGWHWLAALLLVVGVGLAVAGLHAPRPAIVTLEWQTASEVGTLGFLIYRSEQADGDYTQLTPRMLPAAPDPLTGDTHTYRDTTAQAGITYFYLLEDLAADGTRTRHGPIIVAATAVRWAWLIAGAGLVLGGLGLVAWRVVGRG
ncbi:MAG: hypothetical protein HC911_10105 [Chloroflexaceae bacterium]|nr:hypothetical protein [Chloroflexaceae bacterium]